MNQQDREHGGVGASGGIDRPLILVVAKSPRPGRVKTRLGATIGAQAACEFARFFVEATLLSAIRSRIGRVVLFGDVAEAARFECRVPEGVEYWAQGVGTLGDRLRRGFLRAERAEARFTLAVGADTPHLSPDHWIGAVRALHGQPCVLGPSADGGFYLLGLTRGSASAFEGIFAGDDWGTDRVLGRVRRTIGERTQSGVELPMFWDIDTYDDLIQYLTVVERLDRSLLPPDESAASPAQQSEAPGPDFRRTAAAGTAVDVDGVGSPRWSPRATTSDAWFRVARSLRQRLGS